MSIKFRCPHCKKPFNVKEDLAGKRALCPSCRKVLSIPALRSQPAHVDIETLAAAALTSEPAAPPPAPEQTTIEFPCSFCDEKIQVGADLAGKQTPCPHCRRIVKVPVIEKREPKDWRKVDTRLPAGARRDVEPPPPGAWESRRVSAVSPQALLEAEIIPQGGGLTWQQWARRIALVVVVAAVLLVAASFAFRVRSQLKHEQLLSQVQQYFDDKEKLDALDAAELRRALGEYQLLSGNAANARNSFSLARASLLEAKSDPAGQIARDLFLGDLALSQVELAGDAIEIEQGTRLKWDAMQTELQRTLRHLVTLEGRRAVLRLVTRRLVERGEGTRATPLAAQFPDQAELLGIVGLEMLRSGQEDVARTLADQAEQQLRRPPGGKPGEALPLSAKPPAALIALWAALGKTDKIEASSPPDKDKGHDTARLAGEAEGKALKGDLEGARSSAHAAIIPQDRLAALLALIRGALDKDQASAIQNDLSEAQKIAAELQGGVGDPWLLLQLVRLGAQAGQADSIEAVIPFIPEAHLRARAELELVRTRLARQSSPADEALLRTADKSTLEYAQSLEALARQNARLGNGPAFLQTVDSWQPPRLRPFGYLGIVLGLKDSNP